MANLKVIIIGSGLAGNLLANGLIRSDIDVAVYERLEQHTKREGYQIRLGAPALIGMRTCLSEEQVANIAAKFGRAGGMKSAAPLLVDKDFKILIDLTKFPAYTKSAPINRFILRDALADPVFEAGKLTYGRQFVKYEILKAGTEREQVRVWFADGSYDDGDILIGADGSHSKINAQLGLENLHQLNTHISCISKCALPTEKFMTLSPILRDSPVMSFTNERSMYFCAYLPDKTSEAVQKGTIASAEHLEFDDKLSSCMFGMNVPIDSVTEDIFELSNEEQWEEMVGKQITGWGPEYHEILEFLRGSDMYVYRCRASTRPSKNWRRKVRHEKVPEKGHPRVWLMGDAMHAMLPNRGMGGNQAMRDVATVLPLLQKLAEFKSARNELSEAVVTKTCQEYEDEMIPRAFEWVQKSGGMSMVPVDSATFKGKSLLFLGSCFLHFAYVWTKIVGVFTSTTVVDDAPELRN